VSLVESDMPYGRGAGEACSVIALLAPGQGAQTPGMLAPWLVDDGSRAAVARWSDLTGLDLERLGTTADAEEIKDTAVTQPLVVATALLAHSLLSARVELPVSPVAGRMVTAGHSVGELAAAAIAGVLTPDAAVALAAVRGREMAAACALEPTGMSAVLGGNPDEVLARLEELGLDPANRNGAGQIVAAGPHDALARLAEDPPARARVIPLAVAGAFHTRFMAPAEQALGEHAATVTPADPATTFLSNADGAAVSDGADALRRLVAQVTRPVRWDACQASLRELGVTALIELPPAGTLVGLARRPGCRDGAGVRGPRRELPVRPRLRLTESVPGARLLGLGSFQPERVVTNDELAARVETTDEWIRSRVGIASRRIADKDTHLVDMAADAGARALKDSGLEPAEIGAVIVATCTMLDNIPNTAAQVAHRIGISAPAAFDIACSGFSYGLGVAADLVRAGTVRHVLVIGAEKLSDWMDWDDRSTCIIFADGAGAAVVGAAPDEESVGVGPVAWGSAGDQAQTIRINPDTRALHQEGQAVFRWATTRIAPVALRAVELAGLSLADIDVLVPHQANLRIVEAVAKRLRSKGARADLRVADDIVHSGNTSSASIPLAMDHMRAQGRLRSGETVLLVGFGAGLSYAAQVVICP